jgi:hypothetical protein
MKKKIVTILAFVMLAITATFANGDGVSKKALATFSSTFVKAKDVKWEIADNYYKASFRVNGYSLNALLSEEGEMIAVYRNILSTELPLNLQGSLYKGFSNYWIADLVEYAIGTETTYYLTLENADEKIVVKSTDNYDWSLFKKTVKQ